MDSPPSPGSLPAETQIAYTQIIVPPTMRSQYWKYFGFPSNSENQILTKEKVICVLCNAAIAYNKNTSNLRTHLMARHTDKLFAINQKRKEGDDDSPLNDIEDIDARPLIGRTAKRSKIAIKREHRNSNDIQEEDSINESPLLTIIHHHDDDDFTAIDQDAYTLEEMDVETDKLLHDHSHLSTRMNKIESTTQTIALQIDQLQEMLITDLLPISVISGSGFSSFFRDMYIGSNNESIKNEIEKNISRLYSKCEFNVTAHVRNVSKTNKYCICFESFITLENKEFLNIYVNYINADENVYENILYKVMPFNYGKLDIEDVFEGCNLKNCVAAVVNVNKNCVIDLFLLKKSIPKIECYNSIINRCLKIIFNLDPLRSILEQAITICDQNDNYMDQFDNNPEILDEFPWSKYIFLENFQKSMEHFENDNEFKPLLQNCKSIVDYLYQLKLTLTVLSEEMLPISSLIKPLVLQLMQLLPEQTHNGSELLKEIHSIIINQFTEAVLGNAFLTEITFFDPRFQSSLTTAEKQAIKTNILAKYQTENLIANKCSSEIKNEDCESRRKSGLQMFFNRGGMSKPASSVSPKSTLQNELTKYTIDNEDVDLDQCPVNWWKDNSANLKTLYKMSEQYFSIPCFVNLEFRKTIVEQLQSQQNRYLLGRRYFTRMWYLHTNYNYISK